MDPSKFTAFNVLEDEALRAGMYSMTFMLYLFWTSELLRSRGGWRIGLVWVQEHVLISYRYQRVLGMANDTAVVC